MRILIAPDKFKSSLTAKEVAQALAEGIASFDPSIETITLPLADGGEGSVDVLTSAIPGVSKDILVKDPLGRSIDATYWLSGLSAYIELSSASGFELLSPDELNPLYTSTYGSGEMILDAISHGATKIYLFVGGSATNDMGIGMAKALGYQFLDRDGDEVPPVGLSLSFIMDIKKTLKYDPDEVKFYAITDVANRLYGKNGAAYVYGPQKGADKYATEILDKGLRKLAKRCKKYLEKDVAKISGAGAAGGVGAGVLAFLDGSIIPGVDFILDELQFEKQLNGVDIVVTGEGKIDEQTLHGKTISGVVKRASGLGIPVWVIAGQSELTQPQLEKSGISRLDTIMNHCNDSADAMSNASIYLKDIVRHLLNSA